jgi:hypothetical protein
VSQYFAVPEATEQPRRHDCAGQRRKQVGGKEPELPGEDGRAELAGRVDAEGSARDGPHAARASSTPSREPIS